MSARTGKNDYGTPDWLAKAIAAEFDGFDLYARKSIKPGEELTFDYRESVFD